MPEVNRQWVLAARPVGMVKETDFEYREAPLPRPQDGEMLVRNLYLAFDPAMRGWMTDRPSYVPPVKIGEPMRAAAIGQVLESRNAEFKVGDLVQGAFGWQDYAALAPEGFMPVMKIPEQVTPITLALSVLGVTGLTAYFGLLDVGEPKEGEIGIAGGPRKCQWVQGPARFDACIDYKSENVGRRLRELCPKGIDIYFDNVGGEILNTVLAQLARRARVVLCGGISSYNELELPPGPSHYMNLVLQRARMEGFIVLDYLPRFDEAAAKLLEWVKTGEIAYEEDIQEGLENAPQTFLRLFRGENLGKQLLKIADPPIQTN
jgi:NADPH-dependent curcumin reductase CurA